jgi:hypothetical protein
MTGTGSLPVNLPGIQARGVIKTPPNMVPGGPKVGPNHSSFGAHAIGLPGKINVHGLIAGAPAIGLPGKVNVQGTGAGAHAFGLNGQSNLHGPLPGVPAVGLAGRFSVHGPGSAQFIHTPGIAKTVPTPFLPGSSFLGGGMSPGHKP